ncbi:MAG: insulinase family protein, partial [Nisaea sp.]
MDGIKITELANGARVVTDKMASVESVSLGAWLNVGTRHEVAAENGVAHLLEHMVF